VTNWEGRARAEPRRTVTAGRTSRALGRDSTGALVTIAVEGKAAEPFGPLARERLRDVLGGEAQRLGYRLETFRNRRMPTRQPGAMSYCTAPLPS
jgi:hypothetical protein